MKKIASTIANANGNGRKLQLAKETLRSLSGDELGQVAGGSGNQVFNGGGYGGVAGQSVLVPCGAPGLENGGRASDLLLGGCSHIPSVINSFVDRGF